MKEIGRIQQRVNDYRRDDLGYVARIREGLMTRGRESTFIIKQTSRRRVLQKLKPGMAILY